jgi:hypothetical protein
VENVVELAPLDFCDIVCDVQAVKLIGLTPQLQLVNDCATGSRSGPVAHVAHSGLDRAVFHGW